MKQSLKRILLISNGCGRFRLTIGVPRSVCFQIVYGRNADHFQMITLNYQDIEPKRAKL